MPLESYFYKLQKYKYAQNTLYKSFKLDKKNCTVTNKTNGTEK
jgi:hypothetical protein